MSREPKLRRRRVGIPASSIANGIVNTLRAEWSNDLLGPFEDEGWIPAVGAVTAETKLQYMLTLVQGYIQRISSGDWDVEPDHPHRPNALLLRKPGDTCVLAIGLQGRSLRVGGSAVGLAGSRVTPRAVEILAARLAAWFGAH